MQRWPPHEAPPSEMTLWRRLTEAVNQGLVRRDPYRYFLPEMPEKWERQRQEEVGRLSQGPSALASVTAAESDSRRDQPCN
jgi:hypothetical protein